MNLSGIPVECSRISECFADFFDEQIKNIVDKVEIDNDVYNGKIKMDASNLNFMTKNASKIVITHKNFKVGLKRNQTDSYFLIYDEIKHNLLTNYSSDLSCR